MDDEQMVNHFAPLKFYSELNGQTVETELPFVVGIIADFNRANAEDRPHLDARRFIAISADNAEQFFDAVKPSITINLTEISYLDLNLVTPKLVLAFHSFKDIETSSLKKQINEQLRQDDVFRLSKSQMQQLNDCLLRHAGVAELLGTLRGISWLLTNQPDDANLVIKILDVSKTELINDSYKADIAQESTLSRLVYLHEYGTFDGTPYSLMLTDFHFSNDDSDVKLMEQMANLGEKAGCFFVITAAQKMFGGIDFSDTCLQYSSEETGLETLFTSREFLRWRKLRDDKSSRYLAITLSLADAMSAAPNESVNPVFTFAVNLLPSFTGSGLWNFTNKNKTDVSELHLNHETINALTDLGFIAVDGLNGTLLSQVSDLVSFQRAFKYFDRDANDVARLMVSIPYNLLVTSFQRYISMLMRDNFGRDLSGISAAVNQWLNFYVSEHSSGMNSHTKCLKPLSQASFSIEEVVGTPGMYKLFLKVQLQVAGFEYAPCTQHESNVLLG